MKAAELLEKVRKIARKKPVKIVICEGWDERVLRATAVVLKEKLAQIILMGEPSVIKNKANELKVDISGAEIVDFKKSKLKKELAEKLYELRKAKGMTIEEAAKLIENENYFGCMFAYAGYADAVGGSAICPTAELMRPALQILRKKDALVSEIMVMHDPKNDRVIFLSDASLNIEPNSEQLAEIALNAAEAVRDVGMVPKVALLSFSTKGSGGDGPQVTWIREAVKIAQQKDKTLLIDGEMQVDAAVSQFASGRKCPHSPLKGEANALIMPSLTTGNILMHALVQFSQMSVLYIALKGMEKPVSLFGRSMPAESIANILAGLAMEANSGRK